MGKAKRNFKESIRHVFLIYTFIPILILLLLFFVFTFFNSKVIISNKTKKAGNIVNSSLAQVYNSYYNEINEMAESEEVINFVSTHLYSEDVYEKFYDFNNSQKVKSVFHIIDTRGIFLASSVPSDAYINETICNDIIPRIAKKPEDTLSETNKMLYPHDRYTVYTLGKPILKDNKIIGYVVYQLYEEDIQKLIFVQANEITVVTDRYNNIIATTNNITKGVLNKFNPKYDSRGYVEINQGKYYMAKANISSYEISVYTLNSIEYEKYVYVYFCIFVSIISLFLWFLIHFLADKMSSQNTEAIDKLLYSVNELQNGNMNSYVKINTGDEFETLANQYNIMLDKLNELMRKNEELSNLRRLIEVKQLQAQFNPHFIFNVLETLRYAIVVDKDKAQEIVMVLSRLLRYSISNDKNNVLLKDDLNYVEDYLRLHQIRFKERLIYNIETAEGVKNALIPKLLLQTIIENSIKYGYKHQENLIICILGYIEKSNLILEVKDNGYGIEEKQLNEIRDILSGVQNSTQHIGLYNVHRRLVLLYGEAYGIEIESTIGLGTIVKVTIPYEKGDDDV